MRGNLLSLLLLTSGVCMGVTPEEIRDEFSATPGKSGGIYYAYPYDTDSIPPFPAGYEAVYISHDGRHGSRWAINAQQYPYVADILEREHLRGNLTPTGVEVLDKVKTLWRDAEGHAGELSPLGQRQHKGIARRMRERTPGLFADSARISALSSTEPRCIVSMAAFCESLKEGNPALRIERSASPGDMSFIAYTTPEAKAFTATTSRFRKDVSDYRERTVKGERLLRLLFRETPFQDSAPTKADWGEGNSEGVQFLKSLHDIAVTTQNLETDVDLLSIFTPEELYSFWLPLNYNMYVRHGNSPQGEQLGMKSARSLLDDIIERADKALTGGDLKVQLRFGHDSNLIRLLALMGLDGMAESEENPELYYSAWQDYRVSPMGANLQLIFLQPEGVERKSDADDTLVLILHNERGATLPLLSPTAPFYRWSDLKRFWQQGE